MPSTHRHTRFSRRLVGAAILGILLFFLGYGIHFSSNKNTLLETKLTPALLDEVNHSTNSPISHAVTKTASAIDFVELNANDIHEYSRFILDRLKPFTISPPATEKVGEILQYPQYPAGCEAISLTLVLRSFEYDVTPEIIIEDYLAYDTEETGDYVNFYIGSVYENGGAFPPAMVKTANAYLKARSSTMQAYDITGSTPDELFARIAAGQPLMVWTTMYLGYPMHTNYAEGEYRWYNNEHCVVLYGYEGDDVLVSDPLVGLTRYNRARFESIYEACGSMAVAIG